MKLELKDESFKTKSWIKKNTFLTPYPVVVVETRIERT